MASSRVQPDSLLDDGDTVHPTNSGCNPGFDLFSTDRGARRRDSKTRNRARRWSRNAEFRHVQRFPRIRRRGLSPLVGTHLTGRQAVGQLMDSTFFLSPPAEVALLCYVPRGGVVSLLAGHSYRSALIGSRREARRAG